jgi:hypothetical protein
VKKKALENLRARIVRNSSRRHRFDDDSLALLIAEKPDELVLCRRLPAAAAAAVEALASSSVVGDIAPAPTTTELPREHVTLLVLPKTSVLCSCFSVLLRHSLACIASTSTN